MVPGIGRPSTGCGQDQHGHDVRNTGSDVESIEGGVEVVKRDMDHAEGDMDDTGCDVDDDGSNANDNANNVDDDGDDLDTEEVASSSAESTMGDGTASAASGSDENMSRLSVDIDICVYVPRFLDSDSGIKVHKELGSGTFGEVRSDGFTVPMKMRIAYMYSDWTIDLGRWLQTDMAPGRSASHRSPAAHTILRSGLSCNTLHQSPVQARRLACA